MLFVLDSARMELGKYRLRHLRKHLIVIAAAWAVLMALTFLVPYPYILLLFIPVVAWMFYWWGVLDRFNREHREQLNEIRRRHGLVEK